MNLKEQIKIGWPFIAAAIIFILLVIFSTSGVYNVSDILFGAAYILLAITVTYTCNKAAKRFQKNGKYGSCAVSYTHLPCQGIIGRQYLNSFHYIIVVVERLSHPHKNDIG